MFPSLSSSSPDHSPSPPRNRHFGPTFLDPKSSVQDNRINHEVDQSTKYTSNHKKHQSSSFIRIYFNTIATLYFLRDLPLISSIDRSFIKLLQNSSWKALLVESLLVSFISRSMYPTRRKKSTSYQHKPKNLTKQSDPFDISSSYSSSKEFAGQYISTDDNSQSPYKSSNPDLYGLNKQQQQQKQLELQDHQYSKEESSLVWTLIIVLCSARAFFRFVIFWLFDNLYSLIVPDVYQPINPVISYAAETTSATILTASAVSVSCILIVSSFLFSWNIAGMFVGLPYINIANSDLIDNESYDGYNELDETELESIKRDVRNASASIHSYQNRAIIRRKNRAARAARLTATKKFEISKPLENPSIIINDNKSHNTSDVLLEKDTFPNQDITIDDQKGDTSAIPYTSDSELDLGRQQPVILSFKDLDTINDESVISSDKQSKNPTPSLSSSIKKDLNINNNDTQTSESNISSDSIIEHISPTIDSAKLINDNNGRDNTNNNNSSNVMIIPDSKVVDNNDDDIFAEESSVPGNLLDTDDVQDTDLYEVPDILDVSLPEEFLDDNLKLSESEDNYSLNSEFVAKFIGPFSHNHIRKKKSNIKKLIETGSESDSEPSIDNIRINLLPSLRAIAKIENTNELNIIDNKIINIENQIENIEDEIKDVNEELVSDIKKDNSFDDDNIDYWSGSFQKKNGEVIYVPEYDNYPSTPSKNDSNKDEIIKSGSSSVNSFIKKNQVYGRKNVDGWSSSSSCDE